MKSLSFTLAALLGMLAVAQATDVKKDAQNEELVVGATAEEANKANPAEVIEASEVSEEPSDKK